MKSLYILTLSISMMFTACQVSEESINHLNNVSEETTPEEISPNDMTDPNGSNDGSSGSSNPSEPSIAPEELPEEITEELPEEMIEELPEEMIEELPEEMIEELNQLPDMLQCSSEAQTEVFPMTTLRMNIQNVYGQAFTEFNLGYLHDTEISNVNEILDRTIHHPLPHIEENSIEVEFTSESVWVGENNLNPEFFGGDTHLSLSLKNGLYVGSLSSPRFGELTVHCWEFTWEIIDERNWENNMKVYEKEFRYNETTGKCENESGEEGFNHSSIIRVRETGDGECVDMSGWSLEEENYSDPNLAWNIRGALMDQTSLHFANMIGVDFSGVKMQGLDFGYSNLRGTIDEFTVLPQNCEAIDQMIDCIQ